MGKRKQGEGSIRQRENGRWECSIMDGFHSDGRRRYKVFYGDSEEEVKAQRDAYRDAQDRGALVEKDWTFFIASLDIHVLSCLLHINSDKRSE